MYIPGQEWIKEKCWTSSNSTVCEWHHKLWAFTLLVSTEYNYYGTSLSNYESAQVLITALRVSDITSVYIVLSSKGVRHLLWLFILLYLLLMGVELVLSRVHNVYIYSWCCRDGFSNDYLMCARVLVLWPAYWSHCQNEWVAVQALDLGRLLRTATNRLIVGRYRSNSTASPYSTGKYSLGLISFQKSISGAWSIDNWWKFCPKINYDKAKDIRFFCSNICC